MAIFVHGLYQRGLISKKKVTTLMITHNMEDALHFSDRVVMIREGEIYFDRDTKDLGLEDLKDLYRAELV